MKHFRVLPIYVDKAKNFTKIMKVLLFLGKEPVKDAKLQYMYEINQSEDDTDDDN
jgi:hypothetical protein